MTTADQLGIEDMVGAASPLMQELLVIPTPGTAGDPSPAERLLEAPQIFRWGVSDRLLDLMERYFEVPVAYHGVYLRRDMAVKRRGRPTAGISTWRIARSSRLSCT